MRKIPKSYSDFLYYNKNTMLPVPTKMTELYVVYLLPNYPDLYDEWSFYPEMVWEWDPQEPNKAIPLGNISKDHANWMTWGPYPMLWRNPYDPSKLGRNIKGIDTKRQKYVEVNHKMSHISKGIWFTMNVGSGMFFEIGDKILVTRNKISGLLTLLKNIGKSVQNIVDKYGDTFEWNSWGNESTTYREQKGFIKNIWDVTTLKDLLLIVSDNDDPTRLGLEWIANCPILDNWIYDLAKEQGYDMVQYYCAAYNGFWSNEFVWIDNDDDITIDDLATQRVSTTLGKCTDDSKIVLSCKFSPDTSVQLSSITKPTSNKIIPKWKYILIIIIVIIIFLLLIYYYK